MGCAEGAKGTGTAIGQRGAMSEQAQALAQRFEQANDEAIGVVEG